MLGRWLNGAIFLRFDLSCNIVFVLVDAFVLSYLLEKRETKSTDSRPRHDTSKTKDKSVDCFFLTTRVACTRAHISFTVLGEVITHRNVRSLASVFVKLSASDYGFLPVRRRFLCFHQARFV